MITRSRLIELQNALNTGVGFSIFYTSGAEFKALVDELIDQRADRVKLQGEIERLAHELNKATAKLGLLGDTVPEGFTAPEARGWRAGDTFINTDTGVASSAAFLREAGEIEALAQRLAKVEDLLVVHKDILRTHRERCVGLDQRIDKACEIIGGRIGGLEEQIGGLDLAIKGLFVRVAKLDAPAFPSGAATPVEDAIAQAEAEAWTAAVVQEPVAQVEEPGAESDTSPPRRGDRVRLEGARSVGNHLLEDRWYDVLGQQEPDAVFQVREFVGDVVGLHLFWVPNDSPGLMEVRRGAAKLPE